jgi:hypothetical protein
MIISAEAIREIVRSTCPSVQFIWMQDGFYVQPKLSDALAAATASGIAHLRFNGELMDCDDYALLLNAYMKKRRIDLGDSIPASESFHWAFGEAFGNRFNGLDEEHTLNIMLAEDGLLLLEPQTYVHWTPTQNKDSVLIVKM